jgi:C4-dicarboxylate transporter, DctQ subunit
MHRLAAVVDGLSELLGRIAAWSFLCVALIVFFEVVMRYAFLRPTFWVAETAQIVQVFAVFLAAAYVLRHREMITIELLMRDHTTIRRKLAETLGIVMLMIFALPTIWYGFWMWHRVTLAGPASGTILNLPRWLTELPIWLGFALLALQALVELWRIWFVGIPPSRDHTTAEQEVP